MPNSSIRPTRFVRHARDLRTQPLPTGSREHSPSAFDAETGDILARYFAEEYAGYQDDLPTVEAYARRTGGPLVEMGCGTGRLLVPLARAGYQVTGADISPAMLEQARANARAAGVEERVHLVLGDFGSAPLGGPFAFGFTVMNTFMHLLSQPAQISALRHWRNHLASGGLMLIDVLNPDPAELANLDGRLELDKTWQASSSGSTVAKLLSRSLDLAQQIMHVTVLYEESDHNGAVRRTVVPFDLRFIWRFEAELLLDRAGFDLEAVYGDWDLAPFEGGSERLILVARRRE